MPALTQERIIAITSIAAELMEKTQNIRNICFQIIPYILELLKEKDPQNKDPQNIAAREQLNILAAQIDVLTQPDYASIRIIETERAYFSPARIKHNEYMRTAQRRHTLKKRAKIERLEAEEELNFILETKEVPIISAIIEDEEHLIRHGKLEQASPTESTLEPDADSQTKFGEIFTPLPSAIGLPKKN